MKRLFHKELKGLKEKIVSMGSLAEEAVEKAAASLIRRRPELAESVMAGEPAINKIEIEIDEAAHGWIALGQPMASDLRLIAVVMRINNDLERIGDHAINIAEKALAIMKEPRLEVYLQVPEMAAAVSAMLHGALVSFAEEDAALARSILNRDDEVDAYNDYLSGEIGKLLRRDSGIAQVALNLLMIGHNLERVGDLANNIAEDVIYLTEGREVRHHTGK